MGIINPKEKDLRYHDYHEYFEIFLNNRWVEFNNERLSMVSWDDIDTFVLSTKSQKLQTILVRKNRNMYDALKNPTEKTKALHNLLWKL